MSVARLQDRQGSLSTSVAYPCPHTRRLAFSRGLWAKGSVAGINIETRLSPIVRATKIASLSLIGSHLELRTYEDCQQNRTIAGAVLGALNLLMFAHVELNNAQPATMCI